MKDIKMWNWYGESFDKKINDLDISYKNYIDQARHVYDRKKRELDLKKKVDKNLYIKAKQKLQDEEKRALKTLKISQKNETKVLKESIKELKISNSLRLLINFEIKKLYKAITDNANYTNNYYKMLKNTADDVEVKKKNMSELLEKSQQEENKSEFKISLLEIIEKWDSKFGETLINFTSDENLMIFSEKEKIIISKKDNQKLLIDLHKSLISKRESLVNKRNEQIQIYKSTKEESKKKYLQDKKELKKEYLSRILEAEYSYNREYSENISKVKKIYQEHKEKIASNKEKISENAQLRNQKLVEYKNNIKTEIKNLKLQFKKEKRLVKYLFVANSQFKEIKIISDFLKLEYQEDKKTYSNLIKEANLFYLSNETNNFNEVKQKFDERYKNAISQIVSLSKEEKEKLNILLEKNVSKYLKFNKKRNALLFAEAKYLKRLSAIKMDSSYDGEYYEKISQAKEEYARDWNIEINRSIEERKKSQLKLIKLNSELTAEDKENTKKAFEDLKTKFVNKKAELKELYKNKDITKKALKFKLQELKIHKKEEKVSLKLSNEIEKEKSVIKSSFSRVLAKKKVAKKIYESKVSEAIKQTPIENKRNARWKAFGLNLLLPGLAQIFIFKEKIKGVLLALSTLLMYAIFIPFSFGLSWSKIGGIQGLRDLGSSIHNPSAGITPDARYWMFGGVVSIIFLTITISFVIALAISAYRNGKLLEQGMRPQNWSHTKKWISEQGFPWMISIPGWFLLIFVVITPLATSLLISFSNAGFNHEPPGRTVDWVGLSQYGKWYIFRENGLIISLFRVISWTLIWTFSAGFSVIVVGTIFAILVNNERIKGKKFFRLIYIIPWAIPAFVTIIFLKSIFQADANSLVNVILLKIGLISEPVNFFASVHLTRFLLIVVQTWLGHSYIFLLITGNLQSIPKDIYEAASIDGANRKQQFRLLTLPMLLISVAPLLIGQFTFMFNNFTIISLFSGGGPAYSNPTVFLESSTDIIISWIYKLTSSTVQIEGNLGFSSAMVILASIISISIAGYGFAKSAARRGE